MSREKFVTLIVLLFLTATTSNTAELPDGKTVELYGQLQAVTLIYRHGDRNPVEMYHSDPYDVSYWPEGWGQLTNLGKQQLFDLGQWTRSRYRSFLSCSYRSSEMYVRSSDKDRTIMSAMSHLAGLYPPTGNQIWNRKVPWQPISVHTVPSAMDEVLGTDVNPCPAFDRALDAYLQSAEYRDTGILIQRLYDYISATFGEPFHDHRKMTVMYDSFRIQTLHNLTLPEWTKPLYPDNPDFIAAALNYYTLHSSTKLLSKFRTGYLLKDILDRYQAKATNGFSSDLKYYAYSTHDIVLSNLLNTLGIFDSKFPPYSAAILLELRYYQSEYYMLLYYKNSNATPEPLNIPLCGTACPLSQWYQLYDEVLPKNDFQTECNNRV